MTGGASVLAIAGAYGLLANGLGEGRAAVLAPLAVALGVICGLLARLPLRAPIRRRRLLLGLVATLLPAAVASVFGLPLRFLLGEMPYVDGTPSRGSWAVSLLVAAVLTGPPAAGLGLLLRRWRSRKLAAATGLAGAVLLAYGTLFPGLLPARPPKGRVLVTARSGGHVFHVRQNARLRSAGVTLFRNGVPMSGTTGAEAAPRRIRAHLALLLAESPRRALLLGFGTGLTADALRRHQTLEMIDVVDRDRVWPALDGYFPENSGVLADPRVRFFVEDPAVFPRLAPASFYDAVVVEPGPPRFHSESAYATLKPLLVAGGLVSQWLPADGDEPEADARIAAFTRSFRHSLLVDDTLVGSDAPFRFDRLTTRLHDEDWARRDLASFGLPTALDLAARFLRTGPRFRKDFEQGGLPGARDRNREEVLSELQITDADLADTLRAADDLRRFP